MRQAILILSPLLGTPRNVGVMLHLRPLLGPREGRGEAGNSDFVPFVGDPRECRGDVAIPPTLGPREGRGEARNSDFAPLLGTPKNVGVI